MKKLFLFSDYDWDGVTSSIILYKILTFMNINVEIVIPNRFTNGYGLNKESIEKIISIKPDLVITTDTELRLLKKLKF